MDRGVRQTTVHRVIKSWTRLKPLSNQACIVLEKYSSTTVGIQGLASCEQARITDWRKEKGWETES